MGSRKATATRRKGLRRVLMPEQLGAEVSSPACVNMGHSHKRVAFSKYTLGLFLGQRGRTKTLQSSSSSLKRGFKTRVPTGSAAAQASEVPTWHLFSLACFFLKKNDSVNVAGGRFV